MHERVMTVYNSCCVFNTQNESFMDAHESLLGEILLVVCCWIACTYKSCQHHRLQPNALRSMLGSKLWTFLAEHRPVARGGGC